MNHSIIRFVTKSRQICPSFKLYLNRTIFLWITYSDDLDSPDQKYLVINQNQAIKILLTVNHYHDITRLHATLHRRCVIKLHIQLGI